MGVNQIAAKDQQISSAICFTSSLSAAFIRFHLTFQIMSGSGTTPLDEGDLHSLPSHSLKTQALFG